MNKEFIEEMKTILAETKAKLEAELQTVESSVDKRSADEIEVGFPNYGDKEDENAAEVATFSDSLALQRTLDGTLDDVNKALARIDKGTYGVCKYCGEEINEKRLRARPESSSCVKCKVEKMSHY